MIERTTDWELIKQIVTDPSVYPKVTDDKSPSAENWEPVRQDYMHYLLAKDGEEVLGLFAVIADNAVTYRVHTCLLPNSYGPKAATAAKELIAWVFANLDCRRLVTEVPQFNRLALKFSRNAGMKEFGFNPDSYLRNGKLQGVTLLGISREAA